MEKQVPACVPGLRAAGAAALVILRLAGGASACDGKSYSRDVSSGDVVSGGGLVVRLDRVRLIDATPDKYTISVKDDGQLLADHVVLMQFDSLDFKTSCGTVSVGANRNGVFHHGVVSLGWSYF